MSRIETIAEGVTLYLGDCRDILPTLAPTVLITDPVWPNCPAGLIAGSDDPWRLWGETWAVMPDLERAVVVMRHDSNPCFLTEVTLPYARAVILPYVMPGYIGRYLGGDELAYCFGQPIPSRKGQRVIPGRAPAVQPDGRAANGHPCSRSLDHFKFLVRWWSEPADVVIDPFMGSGTTGVSCIDFSRNFLGIEIEEKYFDIACRRMEAEIRKPKLPFDDVPEQMTFAP